MPLDITIRAGTNRPVRLDFTANAPADFTTAGWTFELSVVWDGGRRDYAVGSGLTILDAKNVLWNYPLADTRAFPAGRLARIELQWSVGSGLDKIQDSDAGMLNVTPGISND
jgi:hypothetical protein